MQRNSRFGIVGSKSVLISSAFLLMLVVFFMFATVACSSDDDGVVDGDIDGDIDDDGEAAPTVASKMMMGYAEVDITPPDDTPIGGYGFGAMRKKEGVHDPLMAQVAVFQNDIKEAFVIISIDCVGYFYDFGDWGPGVKVLRETIAKKLEGLVDIEPQHVMLGASHSHYTTDLIGFWQKIGEGPDKDLLQKHIDDISDAVVEAANGIQEIKLYFGSDDLVGYSGRDGFLDDDSDEVCSHIIDNSVTVIYATDLEDNPIVTLADYAKHPCQSPWDSTLVSADYIYGYREEMKKATGAPAMFLQGFSAATHNGDKSLDLGPQDDFDAAYAMGGVLADKVVSIIENNLQENTEFDIHHKWAHYDCLVVGSMFNDLLPRFDMPKRDAVLNEEDNSVLVNELEVSWHKLGSAEFACYPGEGTPEDSYKLKGYMVSPHKFIVGLANDSVGYIISDEALENDKIDYLVEYEMTMGLGINGGDDTWEAMDSIGWYDGAWKDEEEAE